MHVLRKVKKRDEVCGQCKILYYSYEVGCVLCDLKDEGGMLYVVDVDDRIKIH